jgi:hypothetical protein
LAGPDCFNLSAWGHCRTKGPQVRAAAGAVGNTPRLRCRTHSTRCANQPWHWATERACTAPCRRPGHRYGGKSSDPFYVVIPSMLGYGFSAKPTVVGWVRSASAAKLTTGRRH